ncbi:MAG: cytochrome P450 [Thiohalophilus sp.]|uniref:cytochrome P450 n=1 Tax=Thiohalophilus sp. TaxID=3028392 RepID=UPI002870327A|nr:cytochrome P450 [Thiohalophilus sp.]MDR9435610.1 cytochrome P450 [Thiohalophilus sp.]
MTATAQGSKKLPPGPAQPCDLNTTPESFDIIAGLIAEYGDICRLTSESRKSDGYLVNHPDYLKHILVKNHQNYTKGVGFDRVKMLLGNGIIVSDGPFWRRQRRMIQPAFSRKVIAELSEQIKRCNLELLDSWETKAERGEPINITAEASELALQIVLRSLFSEDLDRIIAEQGSNPFAILTEDMARDMQLVIKFRALSKIILEVIERRRREQPERIDFLAMFMDARDKETDAAMTDRELLDEIMTMIIAGHETSAITLNWVWYFLAKYPDVERKLHAEVDSADYEQIPGFDDLEQLPYVKQVVEEALRYYPPVWLYTRRAIEDDQLGDYFVPAGTDIFITPYFLHRHPRYWPQPEKFDPERFAEENIREQHKQAYIPFSAGPRRCIGDFFATVEMQMHFGLMARKFRVQLLDDQPLELEPAVNLRNKQPIYLQLIRR